MKSKKKELCILIVFFMIPFFSLYSQTLKSLIYPLEGRSMRASSGNFVDNRDSVPLEAGETKTIAILEGPGKITHIWMTIFSRDIRYPRSVVLRIYWDKSEVPSVETPIGDFFACGNGMKANVNSLPVKVSSYGRSYNCYWQMPFCKEARITVTNESNEKVTSCYFHIDWTKFEEIPENIMYFNARYHQEYPPQLGQPYTVFIGKGKGHYVGTVLSSHNGIGHWFGEGDDFFYIDGEEDPSIIGTGTEDYFNDAWNMRVHSSLYTGCTVFEPRSPDARITAYRWHIADPIVFSKSLKFVIERRGFIMNASGEVVDHFKPRPDYWSSVSFWYQDGIVEPWCEFPPLKERVDPEVFYHLPDIMDKIRHSSQVELEELSYNRACFYKRGFRVKNDVIGSWIEIPFEIKEKGRYSISMFQLLRGDNGIWKVYIDDKEIYEAGESHIAGGYRVSLANQLPPEKINKTLDFFNIYRKNEHEDYIYGQNLERKIGLFNFEPGIHRLKLVCVGANPLSINSETGKPGYNLTADILSIRKIPFVNMDKWIKKMLELELTKSKK